MGATDGVERAAVGRVIAEADYDLNLVKVPNLVTLWAEVGAGVDERGCGLGGGCCIRVCCAHVDIKHRNEPEVKRKSRSAFLTVGQPSQLFQLA